MQIAPVKIRAERIEMQRQLTRDVRAVHYSNDALFTRTPNDLVDRKNDGGRRSDMADKDHACSPRDAAPEIFDKTFLCFDGSGNRLIDISKSALSRKKTPRPIHGSILMVCCEYFVTRAQLKRTRDDVERDGHVLSVNKIVSMCA